MTTGVWRSLYPQGSHWRRRTLPRCFPGCCHRRSRCIWWNLSRWQLRTGKHFSLMCSSNNKHTQLSIQSVLMCTWLYRRVSCQYIIEVKVSWSVSGLLPHPETSAFHHHCQKSNGVVEAGHWDQQTSVVHLLHEVVGGSGKHLPAEHKLPGWHWLGKGREDLWFNNPHIRHSLIIFLLILRTHSPNI